MTAVELAERASDYDVVVIGGGVLGTSVARDCALRGMRVALFERDDWGAGATSGASPVLEGALRHLPMQRAESRIAREEASRLQDLAPHLSARIPFLLPIPCSTSRFLLPVLETRIVLYGIRGVCPGPFHVRLSASEARALEPGLAGELRGAFAFDAVALDPVRLCFGNVLDARAHGARCEAYHEVVALLRDGEGTGAVRGVVVRDRESGARLEVTARRVVNATGAWCARVAGLAGREARARATVPLRRSVQVVFERPLASVATIVGPLEGRSLALVPWQEQAVLGSLDGYTSYRGDDEREPDAGALDLGDEALDARQATPDEVRALVDAAASVLPAIREARVIDVVAVLRAMPPGPERRAIVDHAEDGAPGLFSMLGGPLAIHRRFAEEMGDRLARELGVGAPGRTDRVPLPGGEARAASPELAERLRLSEPVVRRLWSRHGTGVDAIAARIARNRDERAVVCGCESVVEAEVRHAIAHEGARDVAGVARRTRLGLGACCGMRCAHRCAQVVAEERGLAPSEAHRMAAAFVGARFRARAVALDGAQVRQDALALARFASGGLTRALFERAAPEDPERADVTREGAERERTAPADGAEDRGGDTREVAAREVATSETGTSAAAATEVGSR